MRRFIILVLCLTLFSIPASAQRGADAGKSPSYDGLLAKLKGGDLTIDFKAFRFAFAEKTGIEPRVADPKMQTEMLTLLNEKKFKDVIKLSEAVHKTNFVDMNSHIVTALAYQGLGDPKKSRFHEAVYVGLVNSILKDADGNTPKTAYVVISIAEEYVLLNALELKRGTRAVETTEGHNFHVLTVTDKTTNETVKIYFNIDKVQNVLSSVPKI